MNKVLKVFTAFSGYDSQCLALNRLKKENPGFDYELVGWSEIDENAIKAHNVLFPQYADRNYGDISKVDWSEVDDFDLFTYSSPCFLAGTKVLTNSGSKNIEDIDENDYVITHTGSYKKVVTPMSRQYEGDIYRIMIDGNVVMCTPNHPFYCASKENINKAEWVEARDLVKGFHLPRKVVDFKTDGCTPIIENRQIDKIEIVPNQSEIVYNIEVSDDHSYTANNFVVHNCTDFSLAGKQMGGEEGSGTRSSLLWECRRCIQAKKPKYLLLENVTALVSSKFKPLFDKWCDTVASLGYENFWQTLNAKNYGVPQNRDRVFLVSIRRDSADEIIDYNFPNPIERTCKIEGVLEEKGTVDEKYFINQEKVNEWARDNEKRIVEYIAEREHMKPSDLFFDEVDFDGNEKVERKSPFVEDVKEEVGEADSDEVFTLGIPEHISDKGPKPPKDVTGLDIPEFMEMNDEEWEKLPDYCPKCTEDDEEDKSSAVEQFIDDWSKVYDMSKLTDDNISLHLGIVNVENRLKDNQTHINLQYDRWDGTETETEPVEKIDMSDKITVEEVDESMPVKKKEPKTKKVLKKHMKKTNKVGHCVERIPTPTCTGDVAPTLMATGYANADYKNFYSVGHFPKLGILEKWVEDKKEK